MTLIVGPRSAAPIYTIGPCPDWVSAAFADMYPDDAIEVPTRCAATVLACDGDWEWIAEHAVAVAAAVDGACHAVSGAGAGEWIIGSGIMQGLTFMVCTAANVVGSVASGVGNVVLVLRPVAVGLSGDSFTGMSR